MNKKAIVLFIVSFLIIGFFIYTLYNDENVINNLTSPPISANLSISAVDSKGRNIETGYEVYMDGNIFERGKTSRFGSTLQIVNVNTSIEVYSSNLEGQNYYVGFESENITRKALYRIILKPELPGELEIKRGGSLFLNNEFNFTLTSNKQYRNIVYCYKWSLNILYIDSNDEQIDKPENYTNYDKCFKTEKTLTDFNNLTIYFGFGKWSNLNENDYIDFVFMDSDFRDGMNVTEFNGEDIGGKNVVIRIDN